jgi:hypothetical protein
MAHRATNILLLGFAVATVSGCSDNSAQVADRIRSARSSLVIGVDYTPADFLDRAVIQVSMKGDVSQVEAQQFWCQIVLPAGGSDELVGLWRGSSLQVITVDDSCPTSSPH